MLHDILPDANAFVADVAQPASCCVLETETVHQAVARLRCEADSGRGRYFYVTDTEQRLVGVVPARRLLFSSPVMLVGEVMVHPVMSVKESELFGSALAVLAEHRLLALPVVGEGGRLTGILDISAATRALVELERRESADELFHVAGVDPVPTSSSWGTLAPSLAWTSLSVCIGTLAAVVASAFVSRPSNGVEIAFFVPVVILVAEAAGRHAVAMSVQNLQVTRKRARSAPRHVARGLLLGVVSAALAGALAITWLGMVRLAAIIPVCLFAACLAASFIGDFVPRLLRSWRWGPRIAAGPLVSALTLMVALVSYFGLVALMSS